MGLTTGEYVYMILSSDKEKSMSFRVHWMSLYSGQTGVGTRLSAEWEARERAASASKVWTHTGILLWAAP